MCKYIGLDSPAASEWWARRPLEVIARADYLRGLYLPSTALVRGAVTSTTSVHLLRCRRQGKLLILVYKVHYCDKLDYVF